MTKKPHRKHWQGDEVVPINVTWLEAAFASADCSARELSDRAGVGFSSLQRILSGHQRTCHRSKLDAIANALGVPISALSGGATHLPMTWTDFEDDWAPVPQVDAVPTSLDFTENRFLTACKTALMRDLQHEFGEDAETAYDARYYWVILALRALILPAAWQDRLLRSS